MTTMFLRTTVLSFGLLFTACSGVERIGDLRTAADPLNEVTPESVQNLSSANFKPEVTKSLANNDLDTTILSFLKDQWKAGCDEKNPLNPDFKVGQIEGRKFSRTLRNEHFFIEFQTTSALVDAKSARVVREARPLRGGAKGFKENAFLKQSEVDEGKFVFNLEENADQIMNDPLKAEENVAAQFMRHLNAPFKNRWLNSLRTVFPDAKKDPRLCQFRTLGSELIQVSSGKSIINEITLDAEGKTQVVARVVPSYMKVLQADGELVCQINKVYPVEIREVEVRSLPVIAADGLSHCQGGLVTRIRSYKQVSTNLKSRTLILVDREDVSLAPVLSSL